MELTQIEPTLCPVSFFVAYFHSILYEGAFPPWALAVIEFP